MDITSTRVYIDGNRTRVYNISKEGLCQKYLEKNWIHETDEIDGVEVPKAPASDPKALDEFLNKFHPQAEVDPASIPLPDSPKIEPVPDNSCKPVEQSNKEPIKEVDPASIPLPESPKIEPVPDPPEEEIKLYTNDLIEELYEKITEIWHKYKAWEACDGYPDDFNEDFLVEEIRIIHTYGMTYNPFSNDLRSEVLNYMKKTNREMYCNDYERMYNEIADEIDEYFIREKGQVIPPEGFIAVETVDDSSAIPADDDDDGSAAEDLKFPDNDGDFRNKVEEVYRQKPSKTK